MALFPLCGTGSLSSTRMSIIALILLVFICSFSYCASSNVEHENINNNEDNHHYRLPSRPLSGMDYLNHKQHAKLTKNQLLNLLLKSRLMQDEEEEEDQDREEDRSRRRYDFRANNRRYAPQSFHAMRG